RIISCLTLQPHASTPLRIGRQSIDPSAGQHPGTLLPPRQPLAESLRVIPADSQHRMGRFLAKTRLPPGRSPLLPSILTKRPPAPSRIVVGIGDKPLKALPPCVPNAEQHLRARHRHEFHP